MNMESGTSVKPKTVFAPSKLGWVIIIIIILVFVAIPSYYFYSQYQKTQVLLQGSNPSSENQAQTVIGEVGKLMILPQEQPSIATVSDVSQLPKLPFFANAKNGDKVLIYNAAGEAILYRPSINKIIDVAPVSITQNSPVSTSSSGLVQPKNSTPSATPK